MPVTITCFEVASESDILVDTQPGCRVHRALAPDARFRYITVGDGEAVVRPVDGDAAPVTAWTGSYEVYHERDEAAPPFRADDTASPVVFINCMLVVPGNENAAFEAWKTVNAYMVTKPGYRSHRLHRRLNASAPFGLVNVAEWESAAAWQAAHDAGFRAVAVRPDLPFEPIATLCELIPARPLGRTLVSG